MDAVELQQPHRGSLLATASSLLSSLTGGLGGSSHNLEQESPQAPRPGGSPALLGNPGNGLLKLEHADSADAGTLDPRAHPPADRLRHVVQYQNNSVQLSLKLDVFNGT